VCVGKSADTPEFAVDAIVQWWEMEGKAAYPGADRLLILADAGGSVTSTCGFFTNANLRLPINCNDCELCIPFQPFLWNQRQGRKTAQRANSDDL